MKILYAIQATGNGHIARALEIIPALYEKAEVDILVSGIQGDLPLPFPISFRKHGFSFIFGKKGQVDILKTMNSFRPICLWKDIHRCPVENYDLVIHDFEPITAHACRKKKVPNISLSHQAAFYYPETPRPQKKNTYAEWVIRNYAPSQNHVGLHFHQYHPRIFTPVIRSQIRQLKSENHDHVAVYLPSYSAEYLYRIFERIPETSWRIFSKHSSRITSKKNIRVYPVDNERWLESLSTCRAAIVGAGFEGPAEILYLGKKLMVIPMKNQYEQKCNAAALQEMGVTTYSKISNQSIPKIKEWLKNENAKMIHFPNNTNQIVEEILKVS